jgi:hypothetical protein
MVMQLTKWSYSFGFIAALIAMLVNSQPLPVN